MEQWRSTDGAIDLRCGDWREVLADVDRCDAVICDPPFSDRTHDGQRHGRRDARYADPSEHPILSSRGIEYASLDESGVHEIVGGWASRARGWCCFFTSHDLVPAFTEALQLTERYVFAPIACTQMHRNVRLAGDGPSNWTDHLVVSRPRGGFPKWGALPGAYVGDAFDIGENSLDRSRRIVPGGKPLWLMRTIVRDYTKPGDLVVDPFCGGGTTALACAIEGRRCVTSEIDANTFEKAKARLMKGHTVDMFAGV